MFLGFRIILDRKHRAAVQASQTHGTLRLYPDRLSVLHLNGMDRTLGGTFAAVDTVVFYMEMCGFAQGIICRLMDAMYKCRRYRRHEIPGFPCPDLTDDPAEFPVCLFVDPGDLVRVGEVKPRREIIRHPDAESGIDRTGQIFLCKISRQTGCCSVGRYEKCVPAPDLQMPQKYVHYVRQTNGVGR